MYTPSFQCYISYISLGIIVIHLCKFIFLLSDVVSCELVLTCERAMDAVEGTVGGMEIEEILETLKSSFLFNFRTGNVVVDTGHSPD